MSDRGVSDNITLTLHDAVIGYSNGPSWRIDEHFNGAKVYVVLGPNGSGKSTLGKALCSIDPPISGKLLIDRCDIATMSIELRRKTFHYIAQDPRWSFLANTVEEHLARVESKFDYARNYNANKKSTYDTIFKNLLNKLIAQLTDQEVFSFALYELWRWNKPVAFIDECPDFDDAQMSNFFSELINLRIREGKLTLIARHLPLQNIDFPTNLLEIEKWRQ